MRIIITGGKGLLASNILPIFSSCHELIILDIDEWDISDKEKGEEIISRHRPDAIANFAAITDVDGCEDAVEQARRVNSEAPGVVAQLCEKYDVKLLHVSTDYVFDGEKGSPYEEHDRPNPRSVYGATKLSGETNVMRNNPSALIVRIQWLYGDGGENFITKVRKTAEEKGTVEVVDDQRGAPTYARDLAYPLRTLIEKGISGVYHVANSGSCTWFEFAREIFSQVGMDVKVQPITSSQLKRKATRPAYSVYDCSKLRRNAGVVLRSWQEALREYLGQRG